VLDGGTVRFFIHATKSIISGAEITIAFDFNYHKWYETFAAMHLLTIQAVCYAGDVSIELPSRRQHYTFHTVCLPHAYSKLGNKKCARPKIDPSVIRVYLVFCV